MKIIAIVGSPRPTGNTNFLVDQALQEAAANGCETEKIVLSQHKVNPCLGHDNCASLSVCNQDDDARWILDRYSQADGIILGTPVYFYNMSAQMKTFIDRSFFLYTHKIPLQAKCAGLVIVAGTVGIDITVRALRRCFKLSDGNSDDRVMTVSGYATKLGRIKNDQALVEEAQKLGRRMAEIISLGS